MEGSNRMVGGTLSCASYINSRGLCTQSCDLNCMCSCSTHYEL